MEVKKISFQDLITEKKSINKKCEQFQNTLDTFPKEKSGAVSDLYRNMPEYIEAKKQFGFWFKALQDLNKYIVKNHKTENKNYHLKNRFKTKAMSKKTKHFICKVDDCINKYQTVVQRYCDVSTSAQAKKHFMNEPSIKKYIGNDNYRISFRENSVLIQSGK